MASIQSNKLLAASMGLYGPELVSGTGSGAAGPWVAITMITETTFSAITISDSTGTFTGVAFPVGFILYGKISAFTLTSGSCVAYKGSATA